MVLAIGVRYGKVGHILENMTYALWKRLIRQQDKLQSEWWLWELKGFRKLPLALPSISPFPSDLPPSVWFLVMNSVTRMCQWSQVCITTLKLSTKSWIHIPYLLLNCLHLDAPWMLQTESYPSSISWLSASALQTLAWVLSVWVDHHCHPSLTVLSNPSGSIVSLCTLSPQHQPWEQGRSHLCLSRKHRACHGIGTWISKLCAWMNEHIQRMWGERVI